MTHDDSSEPATPLEPRGLAGRAGGLLLLVGIVFLTLGSLLQVTELASGLWITQLLIFLLPALLFSRASNATARSFLSLQGGLSGRLLGLLLLAAAANYLVAAAMMGLCRNLLPEAWQFADATQVLSALEGPRLGLIVFAVVVLAPLCEEALFRGALLRSLAGRFGPVAGVTLSALAFSAMHVDPIGFLPRFELGLLFGFLLLRTGTLAAPIIAHAVNNGAATFLFFFAGATVEPETEASSWALLAFLGVGALILVPTLQAIVRLTPSGEPGTTSTGAHLERLGACAPFERLDPGRPVAWRPSSPEATGLLILLFLSLGAFTAYLLLASAG